MPGATTNGVANGVNKPHIQYVKKPVSKTAAAAKQTPPVPTHHTASPFEIMASRIANRVAEMAENVTFVERSPPQAAPTVPTYNGPRKPRKLEIRLPSDANANGVRFSAPFLDNTLAKMLELQNKMLRVGAELAKAEGVSEDVKREQFEQSSDLSRIIALICAEKARQGA